jgi:aryl-alcohol dehydrogenase-like predicted oxidoreductase
MIYKQLGTTTRNVSTLGLGTNGVGNFLHNSPEKTANRQKIYQFAFQNGINFFDCAELYGEGYAEHVLGQTFKKNREQVIITSKVIPDNCTYLTLKRSIKESLKRLQTDYLDLYQVHWVNPFVPMEETFAALEETVREGYVKGIGVCNFSLSMVTAARACLNKVKLSSNHIELNLFNQPDVLETLEYYRDNGLSLIGYGALNHLKPGFTQPQQEFLDELMGNYHKTLPQILIRYFTSWENTILLTRTDNINHLQSNLNSFDFDFTPEQIKKFHTLFKSRVQHIPFDQITIPEEYKKIRTYDHFKNPTNLIPSPLTVAQTYVRYNYFKPLKLIDKKGYFILDTYDFYGELKKYYAWRMLYGSSEPIPAFIV